MESRKYRKGAYVPQLNTGPFKSMPGAFSFDCAEYEAI